ncbi:MAG: TetR/AcrR family transcriptional regulator [Oscillospiraceae bacterium]|nr:TetR/AcrR family transcriptional regulator [Oscillospiraceae bacterium]
MDLRIQKTKAAIKKAFLDLRRKKPIEKITVTELSKIAEINKATFYLHYSDIYSLTEEIEDEVIDEILGDIPGLNRFPDDPKKHAAEIFRAFLNKRELLTSIFSGSRHGNFANKIEKRIKSRLYAQFPELRSASNDVVLTFLIQGAFYTVSESSPGRAAECSEEYDTITRITNCIISELKTNAESAVY